MYSKNRKDLVYHCCFSSSFCLFVGGSTRIAASFALSCLGLSGHAGTRMCASKVTALPRNWGVSFFPAPKWLLFYQKWDPNPMAFRGDASQASGLACEVSTQSSPGCVSAVVGWRGCAKLTRFLHLVAPRHDLVTILMEAVRG